MYFVNCGFNFNNNHVLWLCEGKINKHKSEADENWSHNRVGLIEAAGLDGTGTFQKYGVNTLALI